jgi:hypothetical protein
LAVAFLVVIPEGDLLLLLPLQLPLLWPSPFWLSSPKGICFSPFLHRYHRLHSTLNRPNRRKFVSTLQRRDRI